MKLDPEFRTDIEFPPYRILIGLLKRMYIFGQHNYYYFDLDILTITERPTRVAPFLLRPVLGERDALDHPREKALLEGLL